jgi:5-methylcytosine-specific restriction endonuclease McrA
MSGHVLVLNQDYSALTLCSVERATILILLRKADLVHAVPDRFVRSPSTHFPWPSIVRLKGYAAVPYKRIMISRKNVMRRDRFRCQYCGSRDKLTVDHVIPKSRGGRDTWENLVAACTPCNNKKGSRTPDEANMPLARKPFRPSHVMFIRDYMGSVHDTWKPYLFLG